MEQKWRVSFQIHSSPFTADRREVWQWDYAPLPEQIERLRAAAEQWLQRGCILYCVAAISESGEEKDLLPTLDKAYQSRVALCVLRSIFLSAAFKKDWR